MKTALQPLRLFVTAAVILALALALALATPASATRGQPGKQLPFRGVVVVAASGLEFPEPPDELSTFDGRCSVPSTYIISWYLPGKATFPRLGSFTLVEASHCSQWLSADEITFGDGEVTLMASDGDTLNATYGNGSGSFQPDGSFPYTYEWTIAGGTGRFAGATGHLDVSGMVVDWATVTVVETFDGWIAYDASQRSGP